MTQGTDIMEDKTLNAQSIQAALSDQNYEQTLHNDKIDTKFWKQYSPAWNKTGRDRLISRLISRGVVGAAFYVVGGHYAAKNMATYDPSKSPKTVYQWIAHTIDKFISNPLESGINKINGKGKNAVTFRPTLKTDANRSLGKEVILGNADFAMASMGDALGREMLGIASAIKRKAWHDERGNLSGKKLAGSVGASLVRIFTAQLPDWFVSVPYAFQQKFQRKILNRFYPGFEAAGDSTLQGANHRLGKDGNMYGTFAAAGAIDLQLRFTGYNWGTGLWNDFTKVVANKFTGENKDNPNKQAQNEPKKSFFKRSLEYITVHTVKTLLIMTPSIPLFTLFRVPQGKHRGIVIDEHGNSSIREDLQGRKAYDLKEHHSFLDKIINPFGKTAYKLSSKAMRITSDPEHKGMLENWVNASMAYTPYIYAKNELQHHIDNKEADKAILRMVKSMVKGRFSESKEALTDLTRAIKPEGPPAPHIEATRRPVTVQDIIESRQTPEARRQSLIEKGASSLSERISRDKEENTVGTRIAAGV